MDYKQTKAIYKKKADEQINNVLSGLDEMKSSPVTKPVYNELKEYLSKAGKRLRPIMLMMAYKAAGGTEHLLGNIPASVELFHNYTLILDDMMDGDKKRRKNPSFHERIGKVFGESVNHLGDEFSNYMSRNDKESFKRNISECVASYLYSESLDTLRNTGIGIRVDIEARNVLNDANRIVNVGQMMDEILQNMDVVSEDQYMEMIRRKTGNLFRACMEIGALYGNASPKLTKQLVKYADHYGKVFQMTDDLLDIMKKSEKGNTYGSDILNGKNTLLVIKALEHDRNELPVLMQNPKENLDKIIERIHDTGAVDYLRVRINQHKELAQNSLRDMDYLPRRFLTELAEQTANRKK